MSRRTAKGEDIDFDLYKAKQELGSTPPPSRVQERQSSIDKRLRRRMATLGIPEVEIKTPSKTPEKVQLSPTPEVVVEENIDYDTNDELEEVTIESPPKSKRTRQRTKPKPKINTEIEKEAQKDEIEANKE